MNIQDNVNLRDYSTMRLGGTAAHLVEVHTKDELREAVLWAKERTLQTIVIGIGSNIVWRDEGFAGLVIVNQLKGYTETPVEDNTYDITIAAGENWDDAVARTVDSGLMGIERLSLIPGTAGATPVQNVGAYYQDIGSVLTHLEAYDSHNDIFVTISNKDCSFAYRTSRFKKGDRGRFFIISITLRLTRGQPEPPFYPSVQAYLDENNITDYTVQSIRDAIIGIRRSKLPDPAEVANNGSFFANPFVTPAKLAEIQAEYGEVMHWPTDDGRMKMPAAWLIEKAGFTRGHRDPETGMALWRDQALVLVNESAPNTEALLRFKEKIVDGVRDKFGITLEQEPELFP